MKAKNKLTFTSTNPDADTIAFAARKIREAYENELASALSKASDAISKGESKTIRTKGVVITVSQTGKP